MWYEEKHIALLGLFSLYNKKHSIRNAFSLLLYYAGEGNLAHEKAVLTVPSINPD